MMMQATGIGWSNPVLPTTHAAKILLVGEACAGKSTLMTRLCTGQFNPKRCLTVGIDFQTKEVPVGPTRLKLIFWDVAGQERFISLRPGFYRGAQAVALVYDLTDRDSFERLAAWYEEVHYYLPATPKLLVGNKLDLAATAQAMDREEIQHLARRWALPTYETSCATGQGMFELLRGLSSSVVRSIVQAATTRVPAA